MQATRSLRPAILITMAVLFSCCSSAAGLDTSPSEIAAQYKHKLVMLRNFVCGDHLKFDSQGRLVSGGAPGPWTVCRDLRIQDIKPEDGKLKIAGQRIYLFYDSQQKQFRNAAEITKKSTLNEIAKQQKISIEMELATDRQGIEAAMDKLFYSSEQEFLADAPHIWKPFLLGANKPARQPPVSPDSSGISGPAAEGAVSSPEPDSKPLHVGNGVSAPMPAYTPDPDYAETARAAAYQGTVVLTVIVGPDGRVHNPILRRCLGMGLDEKAVEKILAWKFKPAMKDGKPVAVEISVEVQFNLY